MRKTKIVCTLGPATATTDAVRNLCLAGMNVARLNLSHGTHEDHRAHVARVKAVREELSLPIAILLDTKGPEFRIGTFADGKITLGAGDAFTFTAKAGVGNAHAVSVSYKNLPRELSVGDVILLNNGLLSFTVEQIEDDEIHTRVTEGGVLSSRKSMSFPGKHLKQAYLSEQDKADIRLGMEMGVDFIACSFVSCRQDLLDVKNYLHSIGFEGKVELIAKIENQAGVDNIDEICIECDGIMVARGDMGVEIAYEHLPAIQKRLITKCRLLGKRVITATEMLESMIENPRPTRAEIADVANAVYDGTSAVMLSGETAAGKYPVEAVRAMSRIAESTEGTIHYKKRFYATDFLIKNPVDAISHAACAMSIDVGAKAIVACSLSGMTARMVSRFRAPAHIIGLTTNEGSYHRLALSFGVIPALCERFSTTDSLFRTAKEIAVRALALEKGDHIVITGGDTSGRSGNTNLVKIEEI